MSKKKLSYDELVKKNRQDEHALYLKEQGIGEPTTLRSGGGGQHITIAEHEIDEAALEEERVELNRIALEKRNAEIVRLRTVEKWTLDKIAHHFEIPRTHVSKALREAK